MVGEKGVLKELLNGLVSASDFWLWGCTCMLILRLVESFAVLCSESEEGAFRRAALAVWGMGF